MDDNAETTAQQPASAPVDKDEQQPVIDEIDMDAKEDDIIPSQTLRKRKGKESSGDKFGFTAELSEKIASHPIGKHLGAAMVKGGELWDKVLPILVMVYSKIQIGWMRIQPYNPLELTTAFIGLVMVFFGGTYMTLIAAIEAYRISAWDMTRKQLRTLYENFLVAWEESRKDDLVDDDGDGIADVLQIDSDELLMRKAKILVTSIDPVEVSGALSGIYVGFIAVIATLKSKFAQAVALGASLGDMLYDAVFPKVNPILKMVVPEEYQKWIPVLVGYACKSVGVFIAWTIERLISSVYSGLRGAQLLVAGSIAWMKINEMCAPDFNLTEVAGAYTQLFYAGIAAVGVWWQVANLFTVPFPWYIILFPFTVAEWVLMYFVNE